MMILTERVYLTSRTGRAFQILVDRLWPRGLRKDAVRVDLWPQDLAPSDALRRWFAHDQRYNQAVALKEHLERTLTPA